jgi:hypothetical protein
VAAERDKATAKHPEALFQKTPSIEYPDEEAPLMMCLKAPSMWSCCMSFPEQGEENKAKHPHDGFVCRVSKSPIRRMVRCATLREGPRTMTDILLG